MKRGLIYLSVALIGLLMCQCEFNTTESPKTENSEVTTEINAEILTIDQKKNDEINQKNQESWREAKKLQFADSDFLQTKQQMSDDAIAPYDYHTGLVGDKAYNNIVYMKALERVKKHLSVVDGRLVPKLKSGAEIRIAEDLYKFILNVIDSWNQWIKEGKFEIIKTDNGYDIAPVIDDKMQPLSYAKDLTRMGHSERWTAIKEVVDKAPAGTYIHEHFLLNFGTSTLYGEYTGTDSKKRRYSVSDGCGTWGESDPNCIYNYIAYDADINDSQFYIYSLRNSNHQSLASYQLQK